MYQSFLGVEYFRSNSGIMCPGFPQQCQIISLPVFCTKLVSEVFNFLKSNCGISLYFVSHSVSYQTCGYSRHILLPWWSLYIDCFPNKTGTQTHFKGAIVGLVTTTDEEVGHPLLKIIFWKGFANKYIFPIDVGFTLF